MKANIALTIGALSLIAVAAPAANADSYSTTTTTTQQAAPITEYRTISAPSEYRSTTIERSAPISEFRTTTVESAPVIVSPVYIEPSRNTTTIIKERKHHHLVKVPFVTVD
jgi:hypothetical protein